jgi:hypothetical protein
VASATAERRAPTPAERYAAIGGVVLFASLFFHWYGYDTVLHGAGAEIAITGWSATTFLRFLALLVAVAAVGFPAARFAGRLPASLPVAPGMVLTVGGALTLVWVLFRIVSHPRADADLEFGIFVALVGAVLVTVGGWQTLQEERGAGDREEQG